MAWTGVSYHIHDKNIHAMHLPGGPVYRMIDEDTFVAAEVARQLVGKRTLKLHNSIRANRPAQRGGYSIAGSVYANAKHALWHHEGTPRIYPKHGRYLTVPRGHEGTKISGGMLRRNWMAEGKSRGAKPYFLARDISGQRANPYLKDGLRTSIARDSRLSFTRI